MSLTSQIRYIRALDATATDGSGKTGLTFSDFTAKYLVQGGTLTSLTTETIATLGTWAAPTSSAHIRIKELSSSSPCQGIYEVQFANAQVAVAGGTLWLFLSATGAAIQPLELDLITTAALPSAVPGAAGGVFIAGTNAATVVTTSFTTTFTGNLTGSVGSLTTNNDKTGYSLTQSFPSNFSSLAITSGGIVSADLQTIKTQTVTCVAGVTVGAFVGNATAALGVTAAGRVDLGLWLGTAPLTLTSQQVQAIVPDGQKVDVNTIKTGAVVNSGTVTFPTNATLASTANITAGTITTVTNLTNAATAGDFTSTMKTSLTTVIWDGLISGHTTSGTFGGALNSAGGAGDPWSTTLPGAYAAGTAGFIVGTNLNAAITTRSTLTAAQAATGVWQDATPGDFTVTGSIGKSLFTSGNAPGAASGLALVGSNVGTATGVSGAVGSVTGNVGGNVVGSVGSVTAGVSVTTNADKTGYTLTSAYDFAKGTVAMPESYASNGTEPTPSQALYAIQQYLQQFVIASTSYTVKKLNNSTTAFIVTLNDATTPTGAART